MVGRPRVKRQKAFGTSSRAHYARRAQLTIFIIVYPRTVKGLLFRRHTKHG
jgi:hypothetical protein